MVHPAEDRQCTDGCRKCTGEMPCKTCVKAKVECVYQELPKKKPRAQLLEERVGRSCSTVLRPS